MGLFNKDEHVPTWMAGVIAGVVTPLQVSGELDPDSLRSHLDTFIGSGCQAVVVNADTGEGPLLTGTEQDRIVELAVEHLGSDVAVLAGINANSTEAAKVAARRAQELGAVGLQLMPPVVFLGQRLNPDHAAHHYESIAEAVEVPTIVYRTPLTLGYGFDDAFVARLVDGGVVSAIKESSFDRDAYARSYEIVESSNNGVRLLSGADNFVLESLRIGATGTMLAIAAVAPRYWAELFRSHTVGRDGDADELWAAALPFVSAVLRPPFRDFRARIKAILVQYDIIVSATTRLPLRTIGPSEVSQLVDAALPLRAHI